MDFPEEKIVFKRTAFLSGSSLAVTIPIEITGKMNIEKGTPLSLCLDKSKHGLFIGVWNSKQQKKKK